MVDPRRTYSAPTSQDVEEQLLKYDAILALDTRSVLSRVAGFDSVSSFAGARESESLIFASGKSGPILITTSPSRQFDLLSNDFNQTQLVVTILTLTIALWIATRLVSR